MNRWFVVLLVLSACAPNRVASRTPVVSEASLTAVVVRIPMPWYAPRFVARRKFAEAVSEYDAERAIVAKYFTISDDRRFGGLYFWSSPAVARKHFDAAWRADVARRRGAAPDVLFLRAPVVVEGAALPLGEARGRRSLAFPAAAALVLWACADTPEAERSLANALAVEPRLVRGFVVAGEAEVGIVGLWASREDVDAATNESSLGPLGDRIGARATASVVRFEAPLLVDETLRR